MSHNGYVKLYDKFTKWEWYTDPLTAHLYTHCIIKANFKEQEWKGLKIKRGQFVTSLEHLSLETGLTIKQIRTRLKRLSPKYLLVKTANKFTLVTVTDYEKYQVISKKGQTKGKQRATIEEVLSKDNTIIPDWMPLEKWQAFVKMRKAMKSPFTEDAIKLAIGKLKKARDEGFCIESALDDAIENGWKSFYPKKKAKQDLKNRMKTRAMFGE